MACGCGTVSGPTSWARSAGPRRARVGGPILGRELELAVPMPVGEHAEDVAQVRLGVEAVQPRRGYHRELVSGGRRRPRRRRCRRRAYPLHQPVYPPPATVRTMG